MKRRRKGRSITLHKRHGTFSARRKHHRRSKRRLSGLGNFGSMFSGLGNFDGLMKTGLASLVVRFLVTAITDFMTKKDASGKVVPDPNPSRWTKYIPLGVVYLFGEKYLHVNGLRIVSETLLSIMFLNDFIFNDKQKQGVAGLGEDTLSYEQLRGLGNMSDDQLQGLGFDPDAVKNALLYYGTPGGRYVAGLGEASLNAPYAV